MSHLTQQQQEALKAAIQDGLPLTAQPYATLADALNIDESSIIAQMTAWLEEGYIKRLGLVVRHHAVGYRANAMVVWNIPDHHVDALGERLRNHPAITLCYRRPRRLPDWPYNLFCMIHGKDRTLVLQQIDKIIQQFRLQDVNHAVLFSNRQFKQTGGRYARVS